MSRPGIAKFYTTAEVGRHDGRFAVRLDGKAILTPHRAVLAVASHALADAIAKEWHDQGDSVDPHTMPLTRLAYAAIDFVPSHRARLVEKTLAFGLTDLVCYRAEGPPTLVARQADAWDPLLDWVQERFGAPLRTGAGIAFVAQSPESLAALAAAIDACDDFSLMALHGAASLLGSLVLALGMVCGPLDADRAFALSRIDETFQAEAWGRDAEAEARASRLASELRALERFASLAGDLARP